MRGMKKWLPFKSLKGQYEMIDQMMEEREKVPMPELSIDQKEDINYRLQTLSKGEHIAVRYYQDGWIKVTEGIFLGVDKIEKRICFTGFAVPFSCLIGLGEEIYS
jgi:hypothetical protein